MTLAIDTTADAGSIALAQGCDVIEEVPIEAPKGFSHVLFGEIESLLARHKISLADIDLFAAASGPGSFTGVRVGLAAIKGLSEVLGKPAIAVSNLEVLAQFGESNARATIIDAHRGEIYAALHDRNGGIRIVESVLPLERFMAMLPVEDVELITQSAWITQSGELALPPGVRRIQAPTAISAAIAKVALTKTPFDVAAIEANYVRRSDAELLWKEK